MKSTDITKAYVGGTEVGKIYLGGDLVYDANPTPPTPLPYDEQYLTIEALESGELVAGAPVATYTNPIDYSINGGSWVSIYEATTIPVSLGDKIRFRHISTGETSGYSTSSSAYMFINLSPSYSILGQSLAYKVYGNIESLEYGDDFVGKTDMKFVGAFAQMFQKSTGLTDASNLILPGLVAKTMCYNSMFNGCTSLVSAPELPATADTEAVYYSSQNRQNCYTGMFMGCTSLQNAPSSINIASIKGAQDFQYMFSGCTSLQTAPVINSETYDYSQGTPSNVFRGMFGGCTSLNYIKCLFKEPVYGFRDWVNGVSATGTFVKNPNMINAWTTGVDGIPTGWTVQDAQ